MDRQIKKNGTRNRKCRINNKMKGWRRTMGGNTSIIVLTCTAQQDEIEVRTRMDSGPADHQVQVSLDNSYISSYSTD